MDLTRIAVRALLAYAYLLIAARSSGKRAVAEATPFDFVLALIMGDLIDDALWAEVSFAKFAAATGTLFALDVLARMMESRSAAAYWLLNGRPTILLAGGRKKSEGLRREQLSDDDLAHLLRGNGIDRRSEVRLAVLEVDSQLSVLRERRDVKALAGVLLTVAAVLGVAYAVVGVAGDRETLVSPPDAIAEAFYRSVVTRRFEPAAELLSRRSDRNLQALAGDVGRVSDVAAEVVRRSDYSAVVSVTLRGERGEETRDVELVWEDGAWRVVT